MAGLAIDLVGAMGFAIALVSVHEYGHLLTGRILGVPAHAIRVELGGRPPHTALHDGERWLSPDEPGYAAAFCTHRAGARAAWTYVAGGVAFETLMSAIAVLLLVVVGGGEVAIVLAVTSLVLHIAYLGADVALTMRHGRPYGDHAALWALHRRATYALVAAVLVVKVGLVILSRT